VDGFPLTHTDFTHTSPGWQQNLSVPDPQHWPGGQHAPLQHVWIEGQHFPLQTWAVGQQAPLMQVWFDPQHVPLQTLAVAQQAPLMHLWVELVQQLPLQHVWLEVQQLVPQRISPVGHVTRLCAPRPREARPKPKEANRAPPTAPPTRLNASRLEIGLAVILDMSSKSALISLLLLTTPAVRDESQYSVSPDCRLPGNHTVCPNQKSYRRRQNPVLS